MSIQTEPTKNQRTRGVSSGARVAMGCAVGCMVIVLGAAVLFFGGMYAKKSIADRIGRYEAELVACGFATTVSKSAIVVSEAPAEPTLYKAMTVRIQANCPSNIGIIAMSGEIFGAVEGKVYFRGMTLTVHPKAELKGGLDAGEISDC